MAKRASPETQRQMAWIFPLFLVMIGGLIVAGGLTQLTRKSLIMNWPMVQGAVNASEVAVSPTGSDAGARTLYQPAVQYEYRVNGTPYNGSRITEYEFGMTTRTYADEVAARYPAGKQVNVFYNPRNPADCILEPGTKAQVWGLAAFGAFFLVFGLVLMKILPGIVRSQLASEESDDQKPAETGPDQGNGEDFDANDGEDDGQTEDRDDSEAQ